MNKDLLVQASNLTTPVLQGGYCVEYDTQGGVHAAVTGQALQPTVGSCPW